MSRTYQQPGDVLTLTAPTGGVVSGTAYMIGDLFVVALITAVEDEPFEGMRVGVHELAAATHATTEAAAVGDVAYFDASENEITVTATGNTAVGVFTEAKVSTVALATIVLTPQIFSVSDELTVGAAIADIALAAVTGVDGTGDNAASKADVDTRFGTIETAVNTILARLRAAPVIAT
jgi:predicted RecA/RadA family phage recombinase